MKRFACVTILLSLFLSGCQVLGDHMKEPVAFYYVRSDYQQDLTEVIVSEEREASGHLNDLSYLMALYLMGPVDETLLSPIPRGTRIIPVENSPAGVTLKLSESAKTMTDAEFSLACACLALTCMEITDTDEVTITCADRSITMSADTLALYDVTTAAASEETQ